MRFASGKDRGTSAVLCALGRKSLVRATIGRPSVLVANTTPSAPMTPSSPLFPPKIIPPEKADPTTATLQLRIPCRRSKSRSADGQLLKRPTNERDRGDIVLVKEVTG